ncbi:MAG TPA: MBL fold metallo-hydrolase [Thermomicrobiales bacterium]|jgi:phosphoribosyl 1,2-cyclic phosphate phosphodiesterase|nr:MBL fold metallo-hydrolase [Chloroflexota bacterium]HCG29956.1 MBL fold metallo-hydrolase [Chloroflexota bacterium]HQZ88963.1 MBL fold metallo-hydrolase [Thermomicrobiales bacterium]
MEITFLGTGTSNGVPVIGCQCEVCRSTDPRDKRTRSSAIVRVDGQTVLIDTTPELRLQALANNITHIDAVVFTHAHADHVAGFDDLRSFNYLNQAPLETYADGFTAQLLRERFAYAFEYPFPFYGGKPDLRLHAVDRDFDIGPTRFRPFPVSHGRWTVMGFRIHDLVYLTDAKIVPESSLDVMRGAEVLVINGLRERPHPVHLSIPEALDIITEVRPARAYLTHLSHEVGHAAWSERLPSGVELAYDGLTVELGDGH